MTNPNVTIRHARNAVSLIIDGALRRIESQLDQRQTDEATVTLFDTIGEAIQDWEVRSSWASKADGLVGEMQEMLSDEDCPVTVRELLARHHLEP